jgi:hypothetical protein
LRDDLAQPDPYGAFVALVWDGTLIRCDATECGRTERVPTWQSFENVVLGVDEWLEGRAWSTVGGRHYCPEHW